MIPELRKNFNQNFTDEKYNKFISDLDSSLKYPTDFRTCETPLFLSNELKTKLITACDELIEQIKDKNFLIDSNSAIPAHQHVPNETSVPHFLQIDFAIAIENNELIPKLIELQAFPSLYGFMMFFDKKLRKHFPIPDDFTSYFSGFDEAKSVDLLKKIIVADSDPENVILLEIDPEKQKTRIDFAATEKYLGIKTVCLSKVFKRKNKLFYHDKGKDIPIDRIYNRVIFDELERKKIDLNFDFRDELDVYWTSHPNWFFKISKHSLPRLKSDFAPECFYLADLNQYPSDLENFVLKPLFSFAGLGVDVEVTKEKLDLIKNKDNYILQRKINYSPLIETPDGFSKVEIRMMFLWPARLTKGLGGDEEPILVNNLVRTSKGKMMGVDFNKNKTWVGSSIAYHQV